jgi:hypothetical protein
VLDDPTEFRYADSRYSWQQSHCHTDTSVRFLTGLTAAKAWTGLVRSRNVVNQLQNCQSALAESNRKFNAYHIGYYDVTFGPLAIHLISLSPCLLQLVNFKVRNCMTQGWMPPSWKSPWTSLEVTITSWSVTSLTLATFTAWSQCLRTQVNDYKNLADGQSTKNATEISSTVYCSMEITKNSQSPWDFETN